MNLTEKTAIVTGASEGLGRSISQALTEKGCRVFGLARRPGPLEKTRQSLGNLFTPVELDVTAADAVEAWFRETFSGELTLDILINNAGIGRFGDIDQLSSDDWHTMVNTNLNGTYYMTKAAVPLMKKNPGVCHIINIASIAGLLGNPKLAGYNATKFAVRGFSEALFKELRYDGIKVSCMFPGSIETGFSSDSAIGSSSRNKMMPEDVAATAIHLLETPDNHLINEVTMRPLNPKSEG